MVIVIRVDMSLKPKRSVPLLGPSKEMVWILESGVKKDNNVPLSRSHMLTSSVEQIIQSIEICILAYFFRLVEK